MLEQNVAIYRTSNETRFFVVGSALVRVVFATGRVAPAAAGSRRA